MHELSISQQILDIAIDKAKKVNAHTIKNINLVIGEITGILDECVQFYFNFISRDTIACGDILSFHRIPLQVKCRACGNRYFPSQEQWLCPQCQQWDVEITGGKEFYINSIEVDF
jgi:hydrogenase nickel incorporation protein HypA/HybF